MEVVEGAISLLTWVVLILLGVLFLVGLISTRRITAKDKSLRENLSFPVLTMAVAGIAIAFICSLVVLCFPVFGLSTMALTREFEKVECMETPITDTYKMVVTKRRDGKVEASIDGVDGEGGFIWVQQYAVFGSYLLGVQDGNYFWIDQRTRGQRLFDERADYVDSLMELGITTLPEFSAAERICQIRQCQPCAKK